MTVTLSVKLTFQRNFPIRFTSRSTHTRTYRSQRAQPKLETLQAIAGKWSTTVSGITGNDIGPEPSAGEVEKIMPRLQAWTDGSPPETDGKASTSEMSLTKIIRRKGFPADENMPSVPRTSPRLSFTRQTPEQKLRSARDPTDRNAHNRN